VWAEFSHLLRNISGDLLCGQSSRICCAVFLEIYGVDRVLACAAQYFWRSTVWTEFSHLLRIISGDLLCEQISRIYCVALLEIQSVCRVPAFSGYSSRICCAVFLQILLWTEFHCFIGYIA
jgi:hypothetical protein